MIYAYDPNDPYMGVIVQDETHEDFVKMKSFVYTDDLEMAKEAVSEIIQEEINRLYERTSDLQELLDDIEMLEEEDESN